MRTEAGGYQWLGWAAEFVEKDALQNSTLLRGEACKIMFTVLD